MNYIDKLELTDATVLSRVDNDIEEIKKDTRVTSVKLIHFNQEENDYERMLTLEMWRLIVFANLTYNFNIDYDTMTIQLGKYDEENNGFYKHHQD